MYLYLCVYAGMYIHVPYYAQTKIASASVYFKTVYKALNLSF